MKTARTAGHGGGLATYFVHFWIENPGPCTKIVDLTEDELTKLDLLLARAEHAGLIYEVALQRVFDPISFQQFLEEAAILKEIP